MDGHSFSVKGNIEIFKWLWNASLNENTFRETFKAEDILL